MENKMSKKSKKELAIQVQKRYRKATKVQKSAILDEFVASTGYNRKYAIRLLQSNLEIKKPKKPKTGRPVKYSGRIINLLEKLYEISNYICVQRIKPFIPELIEILEKKGEMVIFSEEKTLLCAMSSATINRVLKPYRKKLDGKGKTLTKPGTMLKKQIAIRTGMDWDDHRPGFLEIDCVAHCGQSSSGEFFHTLTATDICTGWTENFILRHKTMHAVVDAMEQLETLLPFPVLGIDSDNGSEFINELLYKFCSEREKKIIFTRSRPYQKNDQAHVEQKNWAVVRKFLGYHRFCTDQHFQLIESIFTMNHIYLNFFQPIRKTFRKSLSNGKERIYYDTAATPFCRSIKFPEVSFQMRAKLFNTYYSSNPVSLITEIRKSILLLNESSSYAVLAN